VALPASAELLMLSVRQVSLQRQLQEQWSARFSAKRFLFSAYLSFFGELTRLSKVFKKHHGKEKPDRKKLQYALRQRGSLALIRIPRFDLWKNADSYEQFMCGGDLFFSKMWVYSHMFGQLNSCQHSFRERHIP